MDKSSDTQSDKSTESKAQVFPISKEHLSDGRKIYINFGYQWEYDNVLSPLVEPIHRVEFGSDKLPKDAR